MIKYIDANDVYDGMRKHGFEAKYITRGEFVDHLPSADVAEVKHGKWFDKGSLSCRCSACGCKSSKESKFCPNCGADMRGETNK